MTEDQLLKKGFTDPLLSNGWKVDEDHIACHYLENDDTYPGIALMINDHQLVRIGIWKNDRDIVYPSLSGVAIGMTETEVAEIYGDRIEIGYHPYLGKAGSYLILKSRDDHYRMIFETSIGSESEEKFASPPNKGPNPMKRVTSFRAGLSGPVGYIEGCS